MTTNTVKDIKNLKVSRMAENLIGSEILKLAAEINTKIKAGEKIYNMTVGDFDPKIFPIPQELKTEIINAYIDNQTNYPPSSGIEDLITAVAYFLKKHLNLDYPANQILIAGGARPIIYSIYKAIIDPEDTVLYPVPSWNNNHYCHLSECNQVFIETKPENNFMPTAEEIKPYISKAQMIALCSPLNPTGTTFSEQGLKDICQLVVDENNRRTSDQKPLYILYDQIYWALTYGQTKHFDPVTLFPELRNYTIFVDGISKAFAATGVRVGWGLGPKKVIDKMKSILGHIGAWAPKAEQVATAKFLRQDQNIQTYLEYFKNEIDFRLTELYNGFIDLKNAGYQVDAIPPQAALYLTVKIDLIGKITSQGKQIIDMRDVTDYILNEAKIGIVPFSSFGTSEDSPWYRISIGTTKREEISGLFDNLRSALQKLA